MKTRRVVIKAVRWCGGLIEWSYDNPQQCSTFWRDLTLNGRAPDTGEALSSAAMFVGDTIKPQKIWELEPRETA